MSAPSGIADNCTSVELDCSDSQLSVAANIMGIITFVAAVIGAGFLTFQFAYVSVRDMETAFTRMEALTFDAQRLRDRIQRDATKLEVCDPHAKKKLDFCLREAELAFKEVEHLLFGTLRLPDVRQAYRLEASERIRNRAIFALRKAEIERVLTNLGKALSELRDAEAEAYRL